VLAVKDAEDAFYTIQEAFNIAETYQIPVIVLTDKLIAESLYQIKKLDQDRIKITRSIITNQSELDKLVSSDRYKLTKDGLSKRWLPGSKANDFDANSDEHTEEGNVTEEAEASQMMIEKRLLKEKTLLSNIKDPEIYTNHVTTYKAKKVLNFIGWGSTYGVMHDTMKYFEKLNIKINYMNVKCLWPLKTERIIKYLKQLPNPILIEGNHNAQLGQLIRMQTGIEIKNKLLKYDGRPFFLDEVIEYVEGVGGRLY
jgi:2-oxoglutarate/2-oxoacid ferredoxin oxidoreductase subunit alpha